MICAVPGVSPALACTSMMPSRASPGPNVCGVSVTGTPVVLIDPLRCASLKMLSAPLPAGRRLMEERDSFGNVTRKSIGTGA